MNEPSPAALGQALDLVWVLAMGFIVMFMQIGFAMPKEPRGPPFPLMKHLFRIQFPSRHYGPRDCLEVCP